MKSIQPKLSDRQLRERLRALREDVAAPPGFSQGVIQRLQQQGLLDAPARAPRAAWSERLGVLFSPWRLGVGAAAALALAVLLLQSPAPQAPAVMAAAKPAPAPAPIVAAAKPVKPRSLPAPAAPAVQAPEQSVALDSSAPAPAAQGRSDAEPASAQLQVASVLKPTMVAFKPEPPAHARPLRGDSEVRNNVVRASRGEAALILFRLAQGGRVRVEIHDRLGRPVAVLADRDFGSGEHSLAWTGSADEGGMAASGVYQVRILAPGYQDRHKLLLAK